MGELAQPVVSSRCLHTSAIFYGIDVGFHILSFCE